MQGKVFAVLVLVSVLASSSAFPQGAPEESSGWRTWDALRNWARPATDYVTQRLPDRTPSQFASDMQEAAVNFRDSAAEHPVVQGVAHAVRPVHQWITDTASSIGRTSFRDLYNSAVGSVQAADETVAQWLNSPSELRAPPPQAENIEQLLH